MESSRAMRKKRLRKKLLECGSVNAKKKGLSSLSVDKMMRDVGRTGSVFYTLFKSKNDMVTALIQHELDRSAALLIDGWEVGRAPNEEKHQSKSSNEDSSPNAWIKRVLQPYVSMEHVADAEYGCALPILSIEIAREGSALRSQFESVFNRIAEEWSARCGCSSEVALALLAQCVGAVMIARAMDTESARVRLLRATNTLAFEMLAKKTKANGRTKTAGA